MAIYPFRRGGTKTFLLRYPYCGGEWALEVQAENWADAKARVAQFPDVTIDGEHLFTLSAPPSHLIAAIVAVRNYSQMFLDFAPIPLGLGIVALILSRAV